MSSKVNLNKNNNKSNSIYKTLTKRLTIMFIPHENSSLFKVSLPVFLLYILGTLLFCAIIATSFVLTKHIKHLTDKVILENKLEYLSKELINNRNFLENLRGIDTELRLLVGLKSKKAIIESEQAVGGPLEIDQINLDTMLTSQRFILSKEQLALNIVLLKKEIENRSESAEEIFNYINQKRSVYASRPKLWPVLGRITSRYGYRKHPFTGRIEFHRGLDIASKKGIPILATAKGRVIFAAWLGGYGRVIIINHGHGYSTVYAHLGKMYIKKGALVTSGQIIGEMGSSGISTGVHLHYEVRFYNKSRNPIRFLNKKIT